MRREAAGLGGAGREENREPDSRREAADEGTGEASAFSGSGIVIFGDSGRLESIAADAGADACVDASDDDEGATDIGVEVFEDDFAWKDPGVGVSGGEVIPVVISVPLPLLPRRDWAGTAVVGVASSSSADGSPSRDRICCFCIVRLRMWFWWWEGDVAAGARIDTGDERSANSCGPRRGGGMNGEPGEGNGEDEAGPGRSMDRERRGGSKKEMEMEVRRRNREMDF